MDDALRGLTATLLNRIKASGLERSEALLDALLPSDDDAIDRSSRRQAEVNPRIIAGAVALVGHHLAGLPLTSRFDCHRSVDRLEPFSVQHAKHHPASTVRGNIAEEMHGTVPVHDHEIHATVII